MLKRCVLPRRGAFTLETTDSDPFKGHQKKGKVCVNCSSIRFKLIFGGILIVLIPMAVSGDVAITDSAKAVTPLSKANKTVGGR